MFSALPGLTEYIDGGHHEKAQKLFTSLQRLLLLAAIVLVIIGTITGPHVISFLTHEKYNILELWFILPMMLTLAAISYGYDLVFLTLFAVREDLWFMKIEFVGLLLSCIFFGASFFVTGIAAKIFIVLLGAITGELAMVVFGTFKLRKYFRTSINL